GLDGRGIEAERLQGSRDLLGGLLVESVDVTGAQVARPGLSHDTDERFYIREQFILESDDLDIDADALG
ncbi:MAG: hypothetical protein M8840_11155, partial [marine benthic group bacterium]|nr:hypothetical protein [Gemmatimonadota bacterium]